MLKSKTVILIPKIFENLLKLRFDELLNEGIFCLKHFSSWIRTFIILTFLLSKKKKKKIIIIIFFLIFIINFHFYWWIEMNSNIIIMFQKSKTGVALKGMNIFQNEGELANNMLITKTGVIKCLSKLVVLWVHSYLSFQSMI